MYIGNDRSDSCSSYDATDSETFSDMTRGGSGGEAELARTGLDYDIKEPVTKFSQLKVIDDHRKKSSEIPKTPTTLFQQGIYIALIFFTPFFSFFLYLRLYGLNIIIIIIIIIISKVYLMNPLIYCINIFIYIYIHIYIYLYICMYIGVSSDPSKYTALICIHI
jgi:hypothetical protein